MGRHFYFGRNNSGYKRWCTGKSVAPQNRKFFSQILVLKRLYPDKKEWNSKVMTELRAVIEEYEDDISLKHIGFPQDWYEQLER